MPLHCQVSYRASHRYTFQSCSTSSGKHLEHIKLVLNVDIGHTSVPLDLKIPHLSLNLLDLTPRAVFISHHFLQCALGWHELLLECGLKMGQSTILISQTSSESKLLSALKSKVCISRIQRKIIRESLAAWS
ncbi:hypothetical protein Tco_0726592 [Tanacetum coccineum]|uniref:Uncharacterized protein n=1 Tax=Tanacetum coccineum TaxID=301880 RepID=A0ABQ4YIA4_9ASTR